jgi:biotin synthase
MVVHDRTINQIVYDSAVKEPLSVFLESIAHRIIHEEYAISKAEAMRIASVGNDDAMLLFHYATQVRTHFKGNKVSLCSIINAKSGRCPEDCTFCSQSAHYQTQAPVYPLMKNEEILEIAKQAKADGAREFGIVISGKGIKNQTELEEIGDIVKFIIEEIGLDVHGSVGIISKGQINYLKKCGMGMLHHNLETSERYFPSVCTTHTYEERLETLRNFKECGMKVCSGGIFGMGETLEDRVDLAFTIRDLDVDTVPMNFLHPIDGTPMEGREPMPPLEILRTIALYRFVLPMMEIKICGGRVVNLRDLQSMIFFAGASSLMVGNYLTTAGRDPELDWQMLKDLEMEISEDGCGKSI